MTNISKNKKNIYIVGGDGFARECYGYIKRMSEQDSTINFKGFLGEGGYVPELKDFSKYFISDISEFKFGQNDYIVIGSGNPEIRKRIYEYSKIRGIKFFTVIDPSVVMLDYVNYGEANIFTYGTFLTSNIKIGNGNIFNTCTNVGHDVEIGNFNFLGPNSQLLGHVIIGNYNTVGTNCVFLPKAKVGDCNKIAPLSAIYKRCKSNSYYMGNPAVKVGDIE